MKKKFVTKYVLFFSIITFFVALDIITKVLTTNVNKVLINSFLSFSYSENSGVAFSFLSGKSWFFVPISVVAIICLIAVFILNKKGGKLFIVGVSLVISGAIGNMIDRIFLGFVRDFIYFSFFPAIFNVADACVTIGTILLVIYLIFFFEKERKRDAKL